MVVGCLSSLNVVIILARKVRLCPVLVLELVPAVVNWTVVVLDDGPIVEIGEVFNMV